MSGFQKSLCICLVMVLPFPAIKAQLNLKPTDTASTTKLIDAARAAYMRAQTDSALLISNASLEASRRLAFTRGEIRSLSLRGYIFSNNAQKRDSVGAIVARLLELSRTRRDSLLAIQAYKLMGHNFFMKQDWGGSMEYYQKALRIAEKTNNKKEMAVANRQIGVAYVSTGDDGCPIGLEYYQKAFQLFQELHDTDAIAGMYFVMGIVYNNMRDYEKGRLCQEQLIRYSKLLGDEASVARAQNELAGYYAGAGDHKRALELLLDSYRRLKKLTLAEEEITNTCRKIVDQLGRLGRTAETKPYLDEQLALSLKLKDATLERSAYEELSKFYAFKKDYKQALAFSNKLVMSLRSMNKGELARQMAEMEAKYQTEKKQTQIEGLQKAKQQQELLAAAESKRQQLIILSIGAGLALVIIFSFFLYKRFRITQRQSAIIAKQKQIVEEKQKDILDSIHYARRIQRSLLPTERYINSKLGSLSQRRQRT